MNIIGVYPHQPDAHYGPDEFERDFLRICKEHRAGGRALLFAFIIYDRSHANLRSVLQDGPKWEGLDEISDVSLTVFAFDSPATTFGNSRRGSKFNEPLLEVLKEHFHIDQAPSTPSILFFQVQGDAVIGHYLIEIRADTFEKTHDEIVAVLRVVTDAVKNVTQENRENAIEIFHLVQDRLAQHKLVGRVCRGIGKIVSIGEKVRKWGHV